MYRSSVSKFSVTTFGDKFIIENDSSYLLNIIASSVWGDWGKKGRENKIKNCFSFANFVGWKVDVTLFLGIYYRRRIYMVIYAFFLYFVNCAILLFLVLWNIIFSSDSISRRLISDSVLIQFLSSTVSTAISLRR